MANKRILKKQIKYICGEVALQCILTREYVDGTDREKLNNLVLSTADLQQKSLKNASFAFDKTPKDFATLAEYHKAASAYYRQAYSVFHKEFNAHIQDILKQLNAEIPAEQREINKKAATK